MLSSSGNSVTSQAQTSSASSAASLLNKKYQFDRVFGPEATQNDVFSEVETLSTSLLDGYSCCLFAYGQTGSGKTFTMEGPTSDRGLNYRLLQNVFSEMQERSATTHYDLNVSIMEIYNEAIVDLLDEKNISSSMASISSSAVGAGLKMRQGERGIFVPDATRMKVTTLAQVEEAMEIGKRVRAVASTDMNEHSSRSHCITCIEVCGRKSGLTKSSESAKTVPSTSASSLHAKSAADAENGVDTVTWSRLFLIDLAGSERVGQSGAQGKALDEAKHINKSLSALARVMECLQMKRQHIPFRDSTLTYLLKDSLVEAKTVMVLNLSPAAVSYGQSINSLNFGVRVRKIERSAPKKNFDLDRDRYNAKNVEMETELKMLRSEVTRLGSQLSQAKADVHAENQALQAKHTEVVAQLRNAATQTAQAHSSEIATLLANHAQEVAALKKALADANANAAKLAEIQKRALAASAQNAKPTPAVVASAIVSQQTVPQQLIAKVNTTTMKTMSTGSKENLASALNDYSFTQSEDTASKSSVNAAKYMHASTPLKPKSITSIIATAPVPVTPKSKPTAYASPSKLASPKVVVDELQRMYLQQLSQITSPAMTGPIVGPPSIVPTMSANGILQPVVLLTPMMARNKPLTIANASSPLPFDMGPSMASLVPSKIETLLPTVITSNSSEQAKVQVTEANVLDSTSSAPCILDDDSYLTLKAQNKESSEVTALKPAMEAITTTTSYSALPPALTAAVAPVTVSTVPLAAQVAAASVPSVTATVSKSTGKTWPHRGCFLDKSVIGRIKKNVVFTDQDELFESGDPLLPIRRLQSSTVPALGAKSSSSVPSTTSTIALVPAAPSTMRTVSPASPIKSGVAVRPTVASAGPGARRVVAKSTTANGAMSSSAFSSSAPKPTPGRSRPVGRVGAPLSGASSVYKTY